MTTFTYGDFTVTITKLEEGYGFDAFDGGTRFVFPNQHQPDAWEDVEAAKDAAKTTIFAHHLMRILIKLPSTEYWVIANTIKFFYLGDWAIDPDSCAGWELQELNEMWSAKRFAK